MTKLYGSLVGAIKQISPMQPVDNAYERNNDAILVRDTITLAAAAAATTIQAIVGLGWESVLHPPGCYVANGALGAGVTISLGDVTYPAALAAATAVNAAGTTLSGLPAVTIGNYWQPLWQQLGYASLTAAKAVGPQAELLFTIAGAAATGILTWQLSGVRRI
jgi:hypothetical protein